MCLNLGQKDKNGRGKQVDDASDDEELAASGRACGSVERIWTRVSSSSFSLSTMSLALSIFGLVFVAELIQWVGQSVLQELVRT